MPETRRYSPDPDLSPAQHHVLSLLAQGVSTTEAAAGVHRNTVGTWRRTNPAFARELEFADKTASPSLRLRAALKVIDMAADPQPGPMKPFPTSATEAEAVHGRTLLLHSLMNERENECVQHSAQSRTAPSATQPIRRAPEPGLKYKRCCALANAS